MRGRPSIGCWSQSRLGRAPAQGWDSKTAAWQGVLKSGDKEEEDRAGTDMVAVTGGRSHIRELV